MNVKTSHFLKKKNLLEKKSKELERELRFGITNNENKPMSEKYRHLYTVNKKNVKIFEEKEEEQEDFFIPKKKGTEAKEVSKEKISFKNYEDKSFIGAGMVTN
jgi:hypothetical protein